jgi:hypothetical protein
MNAREVAMNSSGDAVAILASSGDVAILTKERQG